MSFTKVAPAGIGTEPGSSILIGDSLLHSTGIDIGSSTGVGVQSDSMVMQHSQVL